MAVIWAFEAQILTFQLFGAEVRINMGVILTMCLTGPVRRAEKGVKKGHFGQPE